MDRDQILQMAREHDLHCYGSITENSLYGEIIVEFAASIRATTKEEDARICEELSAYSEYDPAESFAEAIRASK